MSAYDLNASYSDVTHGFTAEAAKTLNSGLSRIEHCVNQLNDTQVWWRPRKEMNSIGNLMLHLCGNVGQWITCAIENTPSTRNRPLEFATRDPVPKAQLFDRLQQAVADATGAIESLNRLEALLQPRRVQGHDTCILAAVLHSVSHFEGHAQEIVGMTRQILGDQYKFQWVPKSPEQQSATPHSA